MNIKSIKLKILIPVVSVLLLGNIISATVSVYTNYNTAKDNLIDKAHIAIKPILLNSNVAIAGANSMKLKSKDTKSLYKASGALTIWIKGKSNTIPKTIFAPEQPPRDIQYTYKKKDTTINLKHLVSKYKSSNNKAVFDGDLLIVTTNLKIKNGGKVIAIFDASAKRALLRWKFKPKIVAGKPVSQRAQQTIEFRLKKW